MAYSGNIALPSNTGDPSKTVAATAATTDLEQWMNQEQLYCQFLYSQQPPPKPPVQEFHSGTMPFMEAMMMPMTDDFTARTPPNDCMPFDQHTLQQPPLAVDQYRCGGLSGVARDAVGDGSDAPKYMSEYPAYIGTPSPTRSPFLFDDSEVRRSPRSTPMIRKSFIQHSPTAPRSSAMKRNRRSSIYTRWTMEEDDLLRQAVALHGPHKWSLIASHVPNRTPMQCSTRWLGALNPHIHKGRWTEHEDVVLKYSVMEFSGIPDDKGGYLPIPWNKIAERIPNRTGIQCQARWSEALDPSVRKGKWSEEEDALLRAGIEKFGRCWIRIAATVPGRTQRQCRTRWMQIKYKEEKMMGKRQQEMALMDKQLASARPASAVDDGSTASCTSTEPDEGHLFELDPVNCGSDVFNFSCLVGDLSSVFMTDGGSQSQTNYQMTPFIVDDFDTFVE